MPSIGRLSVRSGEFETLAAAVLRQGAIRGYAKQQHVTTLMHEQIDDRDAAPSQVGVEQRRAP